MSMSQETKAKYWQNYQFHKYLPETILKRQQIKKVLDAPETELRKRPLHLECVGCGKPGASDMYEGRIG